MKCAVTVSLVPEARGGPFVYWDDLPTAFEKAAKLKFDAIEIFPPSADAAPKDLVAALMKKHNLKVASMGTGGGWVKHKLALTSNDAQIRTHARDFIRSIIQVAGNVGAPAVVGSMQGRWGDGVDRETAMSRLIEALSDLGNYAEQFGVPLIYEPLNRYETNMACTLADGAALLAKLSTKNVKLLADLYHMNIEETDLAESIRTAGSAIGHVHLADSNRRPAGGGHTDFAKIASALREIHYAGYLSAECFPWPDPDSAAAATRRAVERFFA